MFFGLSKETLRQPYSISVPPVEDEAVLNPALQAKLKNDYKIELPPLPEDWEGQKLADYFKLVETAVADMGWKTEPSVDLGLFSFQKLVIYKDLESNAALVVQHPIIKAIAGIKEDNLILSGLPDEKDVDKIEAPAKTYRILDADSSQRVSIEYAVRGQSFVMKGPPGTGKSQTIANIIAECIANGKSVLFVSDKMAAMEVVAPSALVSVTCGISALNFTAAKPTNSRSWRNSNAASTKTLFQENCPRNMNLSV